MTIIGPTTTLPNANNTIHTVKVICNGTGIEVHWDQTPVMIVNATTGQESATRVGFGYVTKAALTDVWFTLLSART